MKYYQIAYQYDKAGGKIHLLDIKANDKEEVIQKLKDNLIIIEKEKW